MFQGKMTSSLLNQEEKKTERLSFIAYKVNGSLMFLFLWNVHTLIMAFLRSD